MSNWKDIKEQLSEVLKAQDEIQKFLEDWNNSGKNFLPDISFKDLYQYLDTLTLLQEVSLLHILMFCVLIFTVINILSVLFGNEIIRFLDLEKRFPKLAKIIQLRRKLQRYYLILSISWILVVSFTEVLFCFSVLFL